MCKMSAIQKKNARIEEILNDVCGVYDFIHTMGESEENIEIIEKSCSELAKIARGEIRFTGDPGF